ncbi:MAG TPA: Uma2 family endonuclease [Clostridiales bacterium]|nr:Uma2 family endonuclease [Clostridiales bacterium]
MPLPQERKYTEDDYNNLPEDVRAELIDGQIYYQAAPSRIHQKILMELAGTIRDYIRSNDGSCEVYPAPFAVKLNEDSSSIVEPDISVICDTGKLTDKGCTGAPDWIIEIVSPGNSSHDYIVKLGLYKATGVREYWIVNPQAKSVLVYYFDEVNLVPKSYTFRDEVKANIYDGLIIDLSTINI